MTMEPNRQAPRLMDKTVSLDREFHMKTSLAIAGLAMTAMSLTACGSDDSTTSAASNAAGSATSSVSVAPSSPNAAPTTSSEPASSPSSSAANSSSASSLATSATPSARAATPAPGKTSHAAAPAGCVTSNGVVLRLVGTTCGFAKNVYAEAHNTEEHGVPSAYSPKAGKSFMFACDVQQGPGTTSTCFGPDGGPEGFMAPGTSVSWTN